MQQNSSPHLFGCVPIIRLSENRFHAVAHAPWDKNPTVCMRKLTVPVGSKQNNLYGLQRLPEIEKPGVAISHPGFAGADDQVPGHFSCMHTDRGWVSPSHNAGPNEAALCSKLMERLTFTIPFVLATPRCEAALWADNSVNWQHETNAYGPSRVVVQLHATNGSIDACLQSSHNGSLALQHRAVQIDQSGQEIHVVVNKVNHLVVKIQGQVHSSDRYCYGFTTSQFRSRSRRSQAPAFQCSCRHLVSQAKTGDRQVVQTLNQAPLLSAFLAGRNGPFEFFLLRTRLTQWIDWLPLKTEVAMPVRKVSNRLGNIIGSFPSLKMEPVEIDYESTIERDLLFFFEYDPTVIAYYPQPMVIVGIDAEGEKHRYTPDFLVIRTTCKEIVECKPEDLVNGPDAQRQIHLGLAWAEANSHDFVLVTDTDLRKDHTLENLKLFWRYARLKVPTAIVAGCMAYLKACPGDISFEDLAAYLSSLANAQGKQPPFMQAQFIYGMLFRHILQADLTRPILPATMIRLSSSVDSIRVTPGLSSILIP